MKKVIFVAGTAYSGSTFFHMMLANDPNGFACGEVRSLLEPRKANHQNISCSCGQNPCPEWKSVKERGGKHWVDIIFQNHPHIDTLVVSSKSPIWIQQQNHILKRKGIDFKNILIWKTPAEYGQSMKRRGFFHEWERSFVNYYRLYAALIEEWRAVRYEDLVKNDEAVLEIVCDYLKIPYFSGKAKFWERSYHVLAGNSSARFHLYDNKEAEAVVKNYDKERMGFYRKFYYRSPDDPDVLSDVQRAYEENRNVHLIQEMLSTYDVNNSAIDRYTATIVAMPPVDVIMRKIKDYYLTQVGLIKYR